MVVPGITTTMAMVAWASDHVKQCQNQIGKSSWHLTMRSSSSISLFLVEMLIEQC
jgi:hypothetical protein